MLACCQRATALCHVVHPNRCRHEFLDTTWAAAPGQHLTHACTTSCCATLYTLQFKRQFDRLHAWDTVIVIVSQHYLNALQYMSCSLDRRSRFAPTCDMLGNPVWATADCIAKCLPHDHFSSCGRQQLVAHQRPHQGFGLSFVHVCRDAKIQVSCMSELQPRTQHNSTY